MKKLENYLDYLVEYIQDTVKAAGAKGVIVGISGGIDSAVVANLAKKAFPNDYLTVWMPINSSQEDLDCANELVERNNLKSITVDLENTFSAFKGSFEQLDAEPTLLALSNSKARLRMTTLYNIAQTKGYLVLGTDNMDEWHIGYFTKFGDGGVDVVPIIHLLKSEVREAARILDVPESIINRAPTAGLWEDQTDEKEIGFSYDRIDAYLMGQDNAPDLVERIEHLHKVSEHKRNIAASPKPFKR
ncbi:NAD(+) synthase [[Acholeplasma] multilocale]|uniref:NAD(+) synthase n=1 Tax=[Acholeplasma] multilocale TaxID=264638 RepID=UPI00054F5DA9|nr:NAD(+) synthase [[Acholeplasma] multilocale]